MKRYLVRMCKSPLLPLSSPVCSILKPGGSYATNIGNLLYQDAIYKHLYCDGNQVTPSFYIDQEVNDKNALANYINAEFDHYIAPLADCFRSSFLSYLVNLTNLIKRLKIPVTIPSCCFELSLSQTMLDVSPEVRQATKEFIGACLDKGPSIGVRGQWTKQALVQLGFRENDFSVIGCASLATFTDTKINKSHKTIRKLGLNLYPSKINDIKVQLFIENLNSKFSKLTYFGQDHNDMRLLAWAKNFDKPQENQVTQTSHSLWQEEKARFYFDSRSWIKDVSKLDFMLGLRFHGAVAPLLAGVPACVILYDRRVQELADFHHIPSIYYKDMPADIDIQELYDSLDFTQFNKYIPINSQIYQNFMQSHNINVKINNLEFEQKMRKTKLCKPLYPQVSDKKRLKLLEQTLQLAQHFSLNPKNYASLVIPDIFYAEGQDYSKLFAQKGYYNRLINYLPKQIEKAAR